MNSKVNNAVDYESSSDDESNGIDDDEVDSYDWEKEMKKRVKEIQEMKELEKKAEELVSEIGEEDGEGSGESEEEKKMRVRKELEKVRLFSCYLCVEYDYLPNCCEFGVY